MKIQTDANENLQIYSSVLLPGQQSLLTVSPSQSNRQAGASARFQSLACVYVITFM